MAFDAYFSGMELVVRLWKDEHGHPAVANEQSRHEVFMVGVRGGGPQCVPDPSVPEHAAHLTIPSSVLLSADRTPDALVETPAGQMALWRLNDVAIDFMDTDDDGVGFRDRLRPTMGSPSPNSPGDWEDIAWVADYARVTGTQPVPAIDLTKPPSDGPASYVAKLNAGLLLAQPPRVANDRLAQYRFSDNYFQSLTDTVRWRLAEPPRIRLTAPNGTQSIIAVSGGPIYFTSLSTALNVVEKEEMVHFTGFSSIFAGNPATPVPVRSFMPDVLIEGEVGWSGGICLCAILNLSHALVYPVHP